MRPHTILSFLWIGIAFLAHSSSAFVVPSSQYHSIARSRLQGTNNDNNNESNPAFALLSTDRDTTPNQGNFFYNDEVSSHLYGYVYLVGFFAAQDPLFLGTFFVLQSLAAGATQQGGLPCNPRIPGVVAALTLGVTLTARYGLGFEPNLLGESYQGPTESAALFEVAICLLNVGWGFFGTWRTKERVNGATYGF